jgi:hypothetical protein
MEDVVKRRHQWVTTAVTVALVTVSALSVEAMRPIRPAAVIRIDECDPIVDRSIEVSWRQWRTSSVVVEYRRWPRRGGTPWVSGRVRSRIVEVSPSVDVGSVVVATPRRALTGRWYVHKVQLLRRQDITDRSRFVEKVFDCGANSSPTSTAPGRACTSRPELVAAPTVSRDEDVLVASSGEWRTIPGCTNSYSYVWSDTESFYSTTANLSLAGEWDLGCSVFVEVTATNAAGETRAESDWASTGRCGGAG